MDRIVGVNTIDLGGGRRGFRGKDTVGGIPGTELAALWHNAIQEEIVGLIEACGGDPSNADFTQLLQAIRSGALNWVPVGGTANALTVDLAPNLPSYTAGLQLHLLTGGVANTGPMTINVDGLGPVPLLRRGGAPMDGGDIPAASLLVAEFEGAAFRFAGLVRSDVADLGLGRNLPIHADVRSADGRLTVSAGAGTVVVTGASVLWRGWKEFDLTALSAPNRTLATSASKTAHLRWDAPGTGQATPASAYPNGRFTLWDLANLTYNPAAQAETDARFDSTFDSILVARVVTDGANVATITALANRVALQASATRAATKPAVSFYQTHTTDWGRTPSVSIAAIEPPGGNRDTDVQVQQTSSTRYATVMIAQGWSDEQVAGTQTAPSWGYSINLTGI